MTFVPAMRTRVAVRGSGARGWLLGWICNGGGDRQSCVQTDDGKLVVGLGYEVLAAGVR